MSQAEVIRIQLKEWSSRSAAQGRDPALVGVHLEDEASRAQAAGLTKERKLLIRDLSCGLEVAATSYVGRICLGNVQITVEPKVGGDLLLKLFRYAYGLRHLNLLSRATYITGGGLFVELLVAQLQAEVRELLGRGLHRRYEARHEVMMRPRGRLDMKDLVARCGRMDQGLRYLHHPRIEDTTINRVILGGLNLAGHLTADTTLRVACSRLTAQLKLSVKQVPLTASLLKKAKQQMNRLVAAYRPAFAIVEILLAGRAISMDEASSSDRALPGLLYDMNRFFQALLDRFLKENLDERLTVLSELRLRGMLAYTPGKNPLNRRAPTPRPDFAIMEKGRVAALLDAKYRDLWTTSLPREMLYQLSLYALSQPGASVASILYPTVAPHATEQQIEINETVGGRQRARIVLHPVNLPRLAELLDEEVSSRQERYRFAQEMLPAG